MNDNIPLMRLHDAWRECERHVYHMFHAMSSISTFWPLDGEAYIALSDERVQDVDQFILRFTKLQDAMGSRFFPALDLGQALPVKPGGFGADLSRGTPRLD